MVLSGRVRAGRWDGELEGESVRRGRRPGIYFVSLVSLVLFPTIKILMKKKTAGVYSPCFIHFPTPPRPVRVVPCLDVLASSNCGQKTNDKTDNYGGPGRNGREKVLAPGHHGDCNTLLPCPR